MILTPAFFINVALLSLHRRPAAGAGRTGLAFAQSHRAGRHPAGHHRHVERHRHPGAQPGARGPPAGGSHRHPQLRRRCAQRRICRVEHRESGIRARSNLSLPNYCLVLVCVSSRHDTARHAHDTHTHDTHTHDTHTHDTGQQQCDEPASGERAVARDGAAGGTEGDGGAGGLALRDDLDRL
jgi:hypothetical protein